MKGIIRLIRLLYIRFQNENERSTKMKATTKNILSSTLITLTISTGCGLGVAGAEEPTRGIASKNRKIQNEVEVARLDVKAKPKKRKVSIWELLGPQRMTENEFTVSRDKAQTVGKNKEVDSEMSMSKIQPSTFLSPTSEPNIVDPFIPEKPSSHSQAATLFKLRF